jgi:predicted RNA-binding protein associated with RNAse of E/G family
VIIAGVPFQVVHFWDPAGRFVGWYVNVESPVVRTGDRLESVDWFLDLWLDPDRTATWKDEEEAAHAVLAGLLAPEDLAAAPAAGRSVLDDVDAARRLGDLTRAGRISRGPGAGRCRRGCRAR